jgi:branched-chain amino acid transport system substrate-binding protein
MLAASGCARRGPRAIRIGAVLPLTGGAAAIGKAAQNGLTLSAEDINAKGGIRGRRIELLVEDGAGDPKVSISAFNKLAETDRVRFIVTTLSSVSMALVPQADKKGVLLFADAAHPGITGRSPLVFRHSNTADEEATALLQCIRRHHAVRKIAILSVNDDYGTAITRELRSRIDQLQGQLSVAAIERYDKAETNFRTVAAKVIAARPDCVIVSGLTASMGLAVRRIREMGYGGELFVTLPFVLLPDAVHAAGDAKRGLYYNTFEFAARSDIRDFRYRYQRRFGEEAPLNAVIEYNTLQVLAAAMERAGDDPASVARQLHSMSSFQALGEHLKITPRGDVVSPVVVQQFASE